MTHKVNIYFRSIPYRISTNRSNSHHNHRVTPTRDSFSRFIRIEGLHIPDFAEWSVNAEHEKGLNMRKNRIRFKDVAGGAKNALKILYKILLFLILTFRFFTNTNTLNYSYFHSLFLDIK